MKQAGFVFAIALVDYAGYRSGGHQSSAKNEIRSEDSRNRTEMAHEQTEYSDNGRILCSLSVSRRQSLSAIS